MGNLKYLFLLILTVLCFKNKLSANPLYSAITDEEARIMRFNLVKTDKNILKANMYLDLAYYFLSKQNKIKADLDTAAIYISEALETSNTLNYPRGKITGILFNGILFHHLDKDAKAIEQYKIALSNAANAKLHDLEGRTWYEFAILQEKKERLNCYKRAKECYRKAGDHIRMKYMDLLTDWANQLTVKGQYFPGYLSISPSNIPPIRQKLDQPIPESERLDLLLKLASIYIYRTGEEKVHIDSAALLLNQAKLLSQKLNDKHGYHESLLLMASVYQERKQNGNAKKLLNLLADTSKIKLMINLSDNYWYSAFKIAGKVNQIFIDSSIYLGRESLKSSMLLKKPFYIKQSMDRLMRIANYRKDLEHSSPELAYAYVIENATRAGYPSKARIYSIFSGDYGNMGNFHKALSYAQMAEKSMKSNISDEDRLSVYINLLMIYKKIEHYEKSLYFHSAIIDRNHLFGKKILIYSVASSYAECLIAMKKSKEALAFLLATFSKIPPDREEALVHYHVALGHCYKALHEFELAEKNYKEAIKLKERQRGNANSLYNDLSLLYASKKMYKEANEAYKNSERYATLNIASYLIPRYNLRSKIDSALGNYESAYKLLSSTKRMSDSVYMISKERHTQELEFQYETQKKEIDLRLKDDNIRFLNQNALLLQQTTDAQEAKLNEANLLAQKNNIAIKLKEKDIDLLNQNARIQTANTQKQEFRQKVSIGAALMLFLITLLLYRLYRNKQSATRQLENKQKEIERSNLKLRGLLEEKEWLLKEIHHRVKNNLHTVMSLLESQSAYLENDALDAVRNSQHRIYAMSLIHQKLYQEDDMKTINMSEYIPDLVCYLKESFDITSKIQFCMDVEFVEFDVAEAVPMGLIINEAITNALKYAFIGRSNGLISISLKQTTEEVYELIIEDNGVGLPVDFELKKVNSLGLKLIKGLSTQLGAILKIENTKGTRISISSLGIHTMSGLLKQA